MDGQMDSWLDRWNRDKQTKIQTDFIESSLGKCNDAKPALQLQLKKSTHLPEF